MGDEGNRLLAMSSQILEADSCVTTAWVSIWCSMMNFVFEKSRKLWGKKKSKFITVYISKAVFEGKR